MSVASANRSTAAPVPGARATAFTGTWPLARAALRRDRVRTPAWGVGLASMVLAVAPTFDRLYPTAQSRLELAASLAASPSLTALLGPLYNPLSTGGLTAWRVGAGLTLALGLVNVFLVVRHSRAEEQAGLAELTGSGVVGRRAPLAAALVAASAVDLVFAVLVVLGLGGRGMGWAGALAFGTTIAGAALVFAAAAAVAAQLTRTARAANGLGSAVVAGMFALASLANSSSPPHAVVWLTPIGWVEQTRPFAGERWWVIALEVVVSAALALVALEVAGRRDLGSGILRPRLGRTTAARWVGSPQTLAWRLDRATLLVWVLGVTALGALVGSLVRSGVDMIASNPRLAEYIRSLGSTSSTIADAYALTVIAMFALVAAAFGLSTVLRLHVDETEGRAELVLSTQASRVQWGAARLVTAASGVVAILLAGGLAMGLVYGATAHDLPGLSVRYTEAALVAVPAAWVLVGLSMAVVGLLPRLTWVLWLVLTYCIVVGELGPLLGLPDWMRKITPFWYVPRWPAEAFAPVPLVVLTALAGLLAVGGLAGLKRRDVPD